MPLFQPKYGSKIFPREPPRLNLVPGTSGKTEREDTFLGLAVQACKLCLKARSFRFQYGTALLGYLDQDLPHFFDQLWLRGNRS